MQFPHDRKVRKIMGFRKSIQGKLLSRILIPLVLAFILLGTVVIISVRMQVTNVIHEKVQLSSESAANEVSDFFTKYLEIVNQMGENEALLEMFRQINTPGTSADVDAYPLAEQCLNNILAYDDNISLAWTVDYNTGESIRSGGVIKGLETDYDVTTRDWYIEAMDAMSLIITEPYIDTDSQIMVTSVIKPAYDHDGTLLGLVAIDMQLEQLNALMGNYSLGNAGFFIITTGKGTIMYHPNVEVLTLDISEGFVTGNVVDAVHQSAFGAYQYELNGQKYHGYLKPIGQIGWMMMSALPEKEFNASIQMIAERIIVMIFLTIVIMVVILTQVARSIVNPIRALAKSADEIAEGNLNVSIDTSAQDEIGLVADALHRNATRLSSYIDYIDEISQSLNRFAEGNLKLDLEHDYQGEFGKIKVALENFSDKFKGIMSEINQAALMVADGSTHLAEGTGKQTISMDNLTSSVNEMMEDLKESTQLSENAQAISSEESTEIEESKEKMEELMLAIQEINDKSEQIGSIIKAIDDIALQTNILSLNASIEAARAGEAGKGFAVVAKEISILATQSSEASKSIAELIHETMLSVNKGVKLANESREMQNLVVQKAVEANDLIDDLMIHLENQIRKSVTITQESSDVYTAVESIAATSEQLNGQSLSLKNMVSKFRF